MKTVLLLLAALALAFGTLGCASQGSINTPILDVGAGGSIGN